MSDQTHNEVNQIDPGPVEIHHGTGGGTPTLVGYALIQIESGSVYTWYIALQQGTTFPLTNQIGDQSVFIGIDAPSNTPEEFFEWVVDHGEFGRDVDTHKAQETFGDWNP